MGAYLDKPVKEKISSDCENKYLKCGSSSMQGWRVTQEDAHNCILDFDTDSSLFAVYDGHGGHEVAEYASQNLPNFIKGLDSYKNGEFEKALKEAFLGFDAELATEPIIDKLKEIAGMKNKELPGREGCSDEEVDYEVDVKTLKKEAKMPLTELIALYATSELQKAKQASKDQGKSDKVEKQSSGPEEGDGTKKEQNTDSEVTSSSSSNNSSSTSFEDSDKNGKCENVQQNGETGGAGDGVACSSSNDDAVTSSSTVNGDISTDNSLTNFEEGNSSSVDSSVTTSGERISKKRAVINMYRSLLDDSYESDSDENDENFAGADANISSEEEGEGEEEEEEDDDDEGAGNNENNGNEENGNSDAEVTETGGEKPGEEEEEEDDDDDDDEEDDDDDDGDDEEEEEEELVDQDGKDLRKKEEPGSDSGCTAVVCLLHKETLYVANAGDSRAVLCRDGQAVDLSVDHKPDDDEEMKRIVAAGGEVTWEGRVNGGLNLSRALGDHLYKKAADLNATEQMITALPDIRIEKVDPLRDEFVILACDGIWNSMSSQEAVDFIRPLIKNGEKLSKICEKMFDKCLAPGMHIVLCDGTGSDNMTCIIVQFNRECNENANSGTKRHSDSPCKEEIDVKKVKLHNVSDNNE